MSWRRLDRPRVATALESWGVTFQQVPNAFQLADGWDLCAGSGIACDNYRWFLWHARNGGSGERTGTAETLRALKDLLVEKDLIREVDVHGHEYERRKCSRCTVVIRAPISRMPHVFWQHDQVCAAATPEGRAKFLRTRRWPVRP